MKANSSQAILLVVNKVLPPRDYRVQYAHYSRQYRVVLAMPRRPEWLPPEAFEKMDFCEGIRLRHLVTFYRLFRRLKRNRHNLALVHFFSTTLVLFGPLIACLAGVRSIVTVTGFGRVFNDNHCLARMTRPLYRLLFRIATGHAERVLFQNRKDMEVARGWLRNCNNKFEYVGSAVAEVQHPVKDYRSVPLSVLMVARLLPSKGIEDFLTIAQQAFGEDIRFVLVGPRSVGHDRLHKLVKDYAAKGVITYQGELHGEELLDAYRESHVFLFTSHGEGMPRVMLEAGLAGLCPIAYDTNATLDLIKPGGGFLLPVRTRDAAVDILRQLSLDRGTLEDNAQRFKAVLHADYTVCGYCRRVDSIIASILCPSLKPTTEMLVQPASKCDLAKIAKIHARAFPEHFLTAMGPAFLRYYYRMILDYAGGIVLVATSHSGELCGFIAGFLDPPDFYNTMRRKSLRLAASIAVALLRSPHQWKRVLQNRRRVARIADSEENQQHVVELSSLGVEPARQGRGIGRELVERFRDQALKLGAESCYLTTDAEENQRVNKFYEGVGFSRHPHADASRDRPMNKYVMVLKCDSRAQTRGYCD